MTYEIPITVEDLLTMGNFTNKERVSMAREITLVILKQQTIEKVSMSMMSRKPRFKWW